MEIAAGGAGAYFPHTWKKDGMKTYNMRKTSCVKLLQNEYQASIQPVQLVANPFVNASSFMDFMLPMGGSPHVLKRIFLELNFNIVAGGANFMCLFIPLCIRSIEIFLGEDTSKAIDVVTGFQNIQTLIAMAGPANYEEVLRLLGINASTGAPTITSASAFTTLPVSFKLPLATLLDVMQLPIGAMPKQKIRLRVNFVSGCDTWTQNDTEAVHFPASAVTVTLCNLLLFGNNVPEVFLNNMLEEWKTKEHSFKVLLNKSQTSQITPVPSGEISVNLTSVTGRISHMFFSFMPSAPPAFADDCVVSIAGYTGFTSASDHDWPVGYPSISYGIRDGFGRMLGGVQFKDFLFVKGLIWNSVMPLDMYSRQTGWSTNLGWYLYSSTMDVAAAVNQGVELGSENAINNSGGTSSLVFRFSSGISTTQRTVVINARVWGAITFLPDIGYMVEELPPNPLSERPVN
jgi:hypothetical protein